MRARGILDKRLGENWTHVLFGNLRPGWIMVPVERTIHFTPLALPRRGGGKGASHGFPRLRARPHFSRASAIGRSFSLTARTAGFWIGRASSRSDGYCGARAGVVGDALLEGQLGLEVGLVGVAELDAAL